MESKLEFASDGELAQVVQGFESGTLAAADWTHAAHIAVAGWYLDDLGQGRALDTLRRNIHHFNEAIGTPNTAARGYHETLTVFWVRILSTAMWKQAPDTALFERVNQLIREFGNAGGLWRDYYSFNVVRSRDARSRWVEPDLRPLQ